MKKPSLWVFALIALALACAGLAGCGGRDTSTPAKALVGHWILVPPGGEWYFRGDGSLTLVTDESHEMHGTWKQASFDPSTRTLVADLAFDADPGSLPYTFIFDPTYETAKFTLGPTDVALAHLTLRYLDDKVKPPQKSQ
jgi:hypothetical protein